MRINNKHEIRFQDASKHVGIKYIYIFPTLRFTKFHSRSIHGTNHSKKFYQLELAFIHQRYVLTYIKTK